MVGQDKHEFKINFSFRDSPYTALLTLVQKEDHDEYHVIPNDDILLKEFGTQIIDNYFNQKDPIRSRHEGDEYTRSIIEGVKDFLNSKHS